MVKRSQEAKFHIAEVNIARFQEPNSSFPRICSLFRSSRGHCNWPKFAFFPRIRPRFKERISWTLKARNSAGHKKALKLQDWKVCNPLEQNRRWVLYFFKLFVVFSCLRNLNPLFNELWIQKCFRIQINTKWTLAHVAACFISSDIRVNLLSWNYLVSPDSRIEVQTHVDSGFPWSAAEKFCRLVRIFWETILDFCISNWFLDFWESS